MAATTRGHFRRFSRLAVFRINLRLFLGRGVERSGFLVPGEKRVRWPAASGLRDSAANTAAWKDARNAPEASQLARLTDAGRVRSRVRGCRLGKAFGSSRARGYLPRPNPALNGHIAWQRSQTQATSGRLPAAMYIPQRRMMADATMRCDRTASWQPFGARFVA